MQARHLSTDTAAPAAPAAWSLYFPESAYVAQDRRALLITELLSALQSEQGWNIVQRLQSVQQEYVLQLDYQQLCQLCDSPDLAAALEMQPLEGLACLQAAVHEVRHPEFKYADTSLVAHSIIDWIHIILSAYYSCVH